jgi:hypothetical protein
LAVLRLADLGQGRHGKKLDQDKEGDESSEDESSEEEDESSDESMDEADESGEGKQREGRLTARREGKEPPARMHHRYERVVFSRVGCFGRGGGVKGRGNGSECVCVCAFVCVGGGWREG